MWFADLGMAEKSRPVLLLAYPTESDARALVIVAPLTSQLRVCGVRYCNLHPPSFYNVIYCKMQDLTPRLF